jgi:energy-coupling factor transport system substrate-specific component
MNIWFWPYLAAGPIADGGAIYWSPGMGVQETLRRYAAFYLVTSLAWDSVRLVGNVMLMLILGRPVLRVLRRFRRRFVFSYAPAPAGATVPPRLNPTGAESPA